MLKYIPSLTLKRIVVSDWDVYLLSDTVIYYSCKLSVWRQKGLSVYLKQSPVRPFCLQADDLIFYQLNWTIHSIKRDFQAVFLNCCKDCPSCLASSTQMGWATWAILVAVKKCSLSDVCSLVMEWLLSPWASNSSTRFPCDNFQANCLCSVAFLLGLWHFIFSWKISY